MPYLDGLFFTNSELKEFDNFIFSWQTMKDKSVCPDCVERGNGEFRTFDEWKSIGLPGFGSTLCGTRCRCVIIPEDIVKIFPSIRGDTINLRDDENLIISKKIEYSKYTKLDRLIEKYKQITGRSETGQFKGGDILPKEYYNIYDVDERIAFMEKLVA